VRMSMIAPSTSSILSCVVIEKSSWP
jgi:hypothetical protein